MKQKNIIEKFIAMSLCVVLLTGCGETESIIPTEIFTKEVSKKSMLSEAEIDFEVPKTYSKILVDINGYEKDAEKEAILIGQSLPAFYSIKNAKTGETVLEGRVKRKEVSEEDGLATGMADFSSLDEPGKYYFETDLLGKSNVFLIRENVYEETLLSSLESLNALRDTEKVTYLPVENSNKMIEVSGGCQISGIGEKDVVESCLAVMDLLTIFEYYPKAFSDDMIEEDKGNDIPDIVDEAIYEIEWLLKMQNSETGGVYTSVSNSSMDTNDVTLVVYGETTKATAYFTACMAKAYMGIKKYDSKLAAKALQAAGLSWKCLLANKEIVTEEQMYRAAVELYRATGNDEYRKVVVDYLKENATLPMETRASFDGALTYIATARSTDVSIDTELISGMLAICEEKAALARGSRYRVQPENLSASELLRNVYELIVIDYILSNTEYEQLEKNYLHYLNGCNSESIDYIKRIKTPDDYAKLIGVSAKLSLSRK